MGWIAIAVMCFGSLAAAVYMQETLRLRPCPLCIIQRMAYFLLGLTALVGAITNPAGKATIALVIVGLIFSLIGEGVAFRNVWIELHPFDSCGADVLEDLINNLPTAQHLRWLFYADGLCGGKMRPLLGLSVPQWSLLGFSVQSFVLLWIGLRHRRAGRLALHGARFV